MVVPVLMTSCHVSENPKTGPVIAHTRIVHNATAKAQELPDHVVTASENVSSACPRPLLDFFFAISSFVSSTRRIREDHFAVWAAAKVFFASASRLPSSLTCCRLIAL